MDTVRFGTQAPLSRPAICGRFHARSSSGTLTETTGRQRALRAPEQSEISSARLTANRLLSALGTREQGPSTNAEVSLLRQKAFTLLVRAYNEVRAAVAFARRIEGDVDNITPSLYAGRGRRNNASGKPAEEQNELEEEIAATDGLNEAVASAFAPVATADVPVGFPGSAPLADG